MGSKFLVYISAIILLVVQISTFAKSHKNDTKEFIPLQQKATIYPILIPPIEDHTLNQTCFVVNFVAQIVVTIINNDTVSQELVEVAKNPMSFTNCSKSVSNFDAFPLMVSVGLNNTSSLTLEAPIPLSDKRIILLEFILNNETGNYSTSGGKLLSPPNSTEAAQVLTPVAPINVTTSLGNASYCGSYHLYSLGSSMYLHPKKNISVDVSFYNLKFEVLRGTVGDFQDVSFNALQDVCPVASGPGNNQPLVGGGADVQLKSMSVIVLIVSLVFNYFNI